MPIAHFRGRFIWSYHNVNIFYSTQDTMSPFIFLSFNNLPPATFRWYKRNTQQLKKQTQILPFRVIWNGIRTFNRTWTGARKELVKWVGHNRFRLFFFVYKVECIYWFVSTVLTRHFIVLNQIQIQWHPFFYASAPASIWSWRLLSSSFRYSILFLFTQLNLINI